MFACRPTFKETIHKNHLNFQVSSYFDKWKNNNNTYDVDSTVDSPTHIIFLIRQKFNNIPTCPIMQLSQFLNSRNLLSNYKIIFKLNFTANITEVCICLIYYLYVKHLWASKLFIFGKLIRF